MLRTQSWVLWIAGLLAILGAIGIARLPLQLVFIEIDMLMPIVGIMCCAVAWTAAPRANGKPTVLTWILWGLGAAAFVTIVPFVRLMIELPFVTFDALPLLVGFFCLLVGYVKARQK